MEIEHSCATIRHNVRQAGDTLLIFKNIVIWISVFGHTYILGNEIGSHGRTIDPLQIANPFR